MFCICTETGASIAIDWKVATVRDISVKIKTLLQGGIKL